MSTRRDSRITQPPRGPGPLDAVTEEAPLEIRTSDIIPETHPRHPQDLGTVLVDPMDPFAPPGPPPLAKAKRDVLISAADYEGYQRLKLDHQDLLAAVRLYLAKESERDLARAELSLRAFAKRGG
jgi:hypothetical protein